MRNSRRSFIRSATGMAALGCMGKLSLAQKPGVAGIAPKQHRQIIDGFGFSEAFHQARTLQSFSDKDQTDILNLLFSPQGGMGFSILRNIIGDGSATNSTDNGVTESIEPSAGIFNWTGDEDQIWIMNEAKKRGCNRFMSTCWSPPAWMKTNNNTYDGELKPAMYQQFADYLATYALEYKSRYGLDIYAISPANEPNFTPTLHYASCRWTSAQLRKFLHENLIPTFASKGVTAEIVIDEHEHWTDDFINDILSDKVCSQAIHIVASHAYAPTSAPYIDINARVRPRFDTAESAGKRIWQTEVSAGDKQITNMNDGVYWARVIHQAMIEDDLSAWLYWWGAAVTDQRSSLVALDAKNKTYQLTKRLFTIGQFARFIRPGYYRVDAKPDPAPNVYFSAYVDPTGKHLVCVAINDDAVPHPLTLQCGDMAVSSCIAVRTSDTEVHARQPPIKPVNGQLDVITTPLSVTTFLIS